MVRSETARRAGAWIAGGIVGAAVAPTLGWLAYSARGIDHDVPLPPAIDAERRTLRDAASGELTYYADVAAPGRPLVLLHSVNAAASAYEMRPLFERYRAERPVYALDLPGFGFSERTDRAYSPRLYADAVLALLRDVASAGGADVVALSLGCEFAARAALEQPELVRSLALISPSGLGGERGSADPRPARGDGAGDGPNRLVASPLLAQAFYDLLATRPSIHYFLARSFVGPVDRGLAEYAYATSHRPGARHAPLTFIRGRLFSPDIRPAVYERLTQPVLVLYDQDSYVDFDALPGVLQRRPNWRTERIVPTKGLPHFERPEATTQALDRFWGSIG